MGNNPDKVEGSITYRNIAPSKAKLVQLDSNFIKKLRHIFKTHPFAVVMEIEMTIKHIWRLGILQLPFKSTTNNLYIEKYYANPVIGTMLTERTHSRPWCATRFTIKIDLYCEIERRM